MSILFLSNLLFTLFLTSCHSSSPSFLDQFKTDAAKLSNEKTFSHGIQYWRENLFANDSVIEMNERVWVGRNQINSFFDMHHSIFRRIQFDIIGTVTVSMSPYRSETFSTQNEDETAFLFGTRFQDSRSKVVETSQKHRVLSLTLFATYVPRDPVGCAATMRWMGIFWYHETQNRIVKMLLTSPTSLLQWEEHLACNWVAEKSVITRKVRELLEGVYRDEKIATMVSRFYEVSTKLTVDESVYEGQGRVIEWYRKWVALGIANQYNVIDELDVVGNTVLVRVATVSTHSSGKCSQSYQWYGLMRFNGHGKIVSEQRFYNQKQIEEAVQILGNCGDMSPRKRDPSQKKDL